ncbi:MAG: ABC transporter ATP-binding protein [Methylomicrobium sp.]|nr:ABC transporter ATP-binding protein [Methylomicrobium sp.]
MSNIAISVRNLTKTYRLYNQPIDRLKEALHPFKKLYHKNFNALESVTFEVKRGETVGIIGRNGSGKSTLLKLITGVLTPTSGRAIVHGRVSAILELGAGFNGEMTGLENIYLNNTINGIPESETAKRVEQIVDFAELGDFIHQPLKTYSSGMKARLAFAVAINVEPDILIVDEALSVGDAAFQRKCFAKMEQIRQAGATILFVSHSEASIVSLCNRAIWLVNGSKVLDGEPKLVTSLYLKHINRPIKKDAVEQEYLQLIESATKNTKADTVNSKSSGAEIVSRSSAAQNQVNLASFNPNLKPTSTVEYKSKGARILDVKVTDLEGKEVNILEHGKQYYYSYRVQVTEPLQKVKLGFLLKQKNGMAIGGGVYPSMKDDIEQLSKSIKVRFKITCNLAEGEYFFNAGVQAKLNDKQDYAHRILDAYMIKVINQSPNMTSIVKIVEETGYEDWQ